MRRAPPRGRSPPTSTSAGRAPRNSETARHMPRLLWRARALGDEQPGHARQGGKAEPPGRDNLSGVLIELSIDRARGDPEQLRGEVLVALRVTQRLADHSHLDLVHRRAER